MKSKINIIAEIGVNHNGKFLTAIKLMQKAKKIGVDNEGKDIVRPSRWGGFILKPHLFEFWINQESRLHTRELFVLN